jgi:hypothetical protein
MRKILLWIWQFPQMILGYILSRIWKRRLKLLPDSTIPNVQAMEDKYKVKIYIVDGANHKLNPVLSNIDGFSCGKYICLTSWYGPETVSHEVGHYLQSFRLGPLYLFVIGILSAVFCNLWDRFLHKSWPKKKRQEWYYSRFPENWADRLGGVKRKEGI